MQPFGARSPDQHFRRDSSFAIPLGAATAEVRPSCRTSARACIEFPRDAKPTSAAGRVTQDPWVLHGKSAPAAPASATLDLCAPSTGFAASRADASVAASLPVPLSPGMANNARCDQALLRDPTAPDEIGASAVRHLDSCEGDGARAS